MFGSDRIKNKLITAAIMSLCLAAYGLFFKPMWDNWLVANGHVVGFGETAVGYFMAIVVTFLGSWLLTRKKGAEQ